MLKKRGGKSSVADSVRNQGNLHRINQANFFVKSRYNNPGEFLIKSSKTKKEEFLAKDDLLYPN